MKDNEFIIKIRQNENNTFMDLEEALKKELKELKVLPSDITLKMLPNEWNGNIVTHTFVFEKKKGN